MNFPLSLISTLSFLSPLAAQTVGGGYGPEFSLEGTVTGANIGKKFATIADVNGDGIDDLAIGVPNANSGGKQEAGYAELRSGSDGSLIYFWQGAISLQRLGREVADLGDLNGDGISEIGVSCHNPADFGQVYVYSGINGNQIATWGSYLKQSDRFGASMLNIGDIDLDGTPDILVGAPNDGLPGSSTRTGSATLISGASGIAIYRAEGSEANSEYGASMTSLGDINGDGYDDAHIGAPKAKFNNRSQAGAVYLISGVDGAELWSVGGQNFQFRFGNDIANAGDVDQDGVDDLIVGVPGDDHGRVLVYSGANGVQLFWLSSPESQADFGFSVSTAGDFNGDNIPDFLIGAPIVDRPGLANAGAAYIYSGDNGSMLWSAYGHQAESQFGSRVRYLGRASGALSYALGTSLFDLEGLAGAGRLDLYTEQPFLSANAESVSVAAGAHIHYHLDFPPYLAGYEYKVLASKSGNGPFHYGVDIPLTYDHTLQSTWDGVHPGATAGSHSGLLDEAGDATAYIIMGPGSYTHMVGITFQIAAVAMPTGGLPEFSSKAVQLEVLP